jgi:ribosomal protein L7/L12
MSAISANQEQQLKEMAAQGNKIAAIAQYREITGVSLREAKEGVEALMHAAPASLPVSLQDSEPDPFLENRIKRLLAERKKIEAVKIYREAHQCGLKEAKDAVDLIQAEMRREGYSNTSSMPTIGADPFAAEARENRRRMIIFVALLLLAAGGLALFFVLRSGGLETSQSV